MLRTLKNLTPLSLRIFLKERLPRKAVSAIATKPGTSHKLEGSVHAAEVAKGRHMPARAECPICGTALISANRQEEVRCTGCGSSASQRRLALAFYAYAKADSRILVLGPDTVLKSLCDSARGAYWATDLAHVPSEWRTHVDLCIHAPELPGSVMSLEKLLKDTDALLSPQGRQIFTLEGFSASWLLLKWQMQTARFVRWLEKKGCNEVLEFAADDHFGPGSSQIFACEATGSLADVIIILPKITSAKNAAH